MDPITKALTDGLEGRKLSQKAKQEILTGKPHKKRNLIPSIAAICIFALALFLFFTNKVEVTPHLASTDAKFGPVDEAITNYFNSEAPKLKMEHEKRHDPFYNGDAYLMRLSLEQNSGQFYSDSSLSGKDRFIISELLHYVQEAIWHNNVWVDIEPVQSIEELVKQAPELISKLKPNVEIPYMKITDEKQQQWNYSSFDTKRWVSYIAILALLVAFIVYLVKNKHFIITALVVFITAVSFSQPFWQPFKDVSAYDERTLVEVVEQGLEEMNVKVVGQPELQYAASIYKTRTALVSFEDGMSVLAVFKYENGRFIKQGMTWHSGEIFREYVTDTEDDSFLISPIAFKSGHKVAQFRVYNEHNLFAETAITQKEPGIIYFKQPKQISVLQLEFLDANGKTVQ